MLGSAKFILVSGAELNFYEKFFTYSLNINDVLFKVCIEINNGCAELCWQRYKMVSLYFFHEKITLNILFQMTDVCNVTYSEVGFRTNMATRWH